MADPTSALTFVDLQKYLAEFVGIANTSGSAIAVPSDALDLDMIKRTINEAIRMLIADAPRAGWRWQYPKGTVVLWPDASGTASGVYDGTSETTITASAAAFYNSMEGHDLTIGGTAYEIASYSSSTVVTVTGDATATDEAFTITATGAYTLPDDFSGQVYGEAIWTADTNEGVSPEWVGAEPILRDWETGVSDCMPRRIAYRPMASFGRRWELIGDGIPTSASTLEIQYLLHFDDLVEDSDKPPCGFEFDDLLLAACKSRWELNYETPGPLTQYYREIALPNAYKIASRQQPRRLGTMGDGEGLGFRQSIRRNDITGFTT